MVALRLAGDLADAKLRAIPLPVAPSLRPKGNSC